MADLTAYFSHGQFITVRYKRQDNLRRRVLTSSFPSLLLPVGREENPDEFMIKCLFPPARTPGSLSVTHKESGP